jgi:hypothetical protein
VWHFVNDLPARHLHANCSVGDHLFLVAWRLPGRRLREGEAAGVALWGHPSRALPPII